MTLDGPDRGEGAASSNEGVTLQGGAATPVPASTATSTPARTTGTPRIDASTALGRALLGSGVGHAVLLGVLVAVSCLAQRPAPPQPVLVARLVRLGPPRPKEALPQLDAGPKGAAKAARPPSPRAADAKAASGAPGAPDPAASQQRARTRAEARSALARLKREAAGAAEGDVAGDTDAAAEGERYLALVKRCLEDNYVIEGIDKTRLAGLKALVVVRIQGDGRIVGYRLAQSPGVATFEQAIGRAVTACGRVPPPPMALQKVLLVEGLGVYFDP